MCNNKISRTAYRVVLSASKTAQLCFLHRRERGVVLL
nr:MAG TPA_asm: hypothetical protein [Caudoviricetes sp.]